MSNPVKAGIALLLSVFFGATIPIVIKLALTDVGPFYILFLRCFFGTLALLPVLIIEKPYKKKHFNKLLLLGLLASGNTAIFVWGIQYTSASVSQVLYAAMPLLIILLSSFVWKEKVATHKIIGVLIGLLGIFYIVYLSFIEKGTTITGSIKGNIAVLLAMCCWMFYIIYSKKLSSQFSPLVISSVSIFVSLIVATILFGYEIISPAYTYSLLNPKTIIAGIYLGVVGSALFYVVYQYGIKYSSALTASLTSYLQPLTAVVMASILLGETITSGFMIGSAFVLFGIFLTTMVELHKRRKKE